MNQDALLGILIPQMLKKETATTIAEPTGDVMYLLSALSTDGTVLPMLTEKVEQKGAVIKKSEDLGVKRLAYPINRHNELTLVSLFFEATAKAIQELNQELRHQDQVERFLITRWNAPLEQSERVSKIKMAADKVAARATGEEEQRV